MEARAISRTFNVVGIRHQGSFSDYGSIVPAAAQQFLARAEQVTTGTGIEVSLYEPKRGADHREGFFYTGILVSAKPAELPDGMEYIELTSTYATVRGEEREMGDLYSFLERWIQEQGLVKDWPDALLVELFDGTGQVEIYLPLKG